MDKWRLTEVKSTCGGRRALEVVYSAHEEALAVGNEIWSTSDWSKGEGEGGRGEGGRGEGGRV